MAVKLTAFWDVAPCTVVEANRRSSGAYSLRRPDDGRIIYLWKFSLLLRDYTAQYLKGLWSSHSTTLQLQISQSETLCTIIDFPQCSVEQEHYDWRPREKRMQMWATSLCLDGQAPRWTLLYFTLLLIKCYYKKLPSAKINKSFTHSKTSYTEETGSMKSSF
jgi:hypothetical protein